jgi:hypothetical protein
MNILKLFEQIRLTATPLVVVRTADPAACRVRLTRAASNVAGTTAPAILSWDILRGVVALTDVAKALVPSGKGAVQPAMLLRNLDDVGRDASLHDALIFTHNLHLFWSKDPSVVQGIWNLRDVFKAQGHTLVMLVPDGASIPAEIRDDVTVLDDPRPDADELREIVLSQFKALRETSDRKIADPKPAALTRAVSAVAGLPAFGSEQAVALSMTSKGLDLAALWDRKVAALEEIPGVEIWRGAETFDDLRGVDSLRRYCEDLVAGEPTNLVVFLDEIEKQFGNVGSALDSGASKGQFGQVLSYMEDSKVDGLMLVGPPGTGKSHIAKALGKLAGCLVMALNFSKAKGSLVGQTEANTAAILKTIKAVAQGGVLFVATSNDIGALPPELLARFTLGTYFVERARTNDEREAQWKVQMKSFGLNGGQQKIPTGGDNWSGRDIRNACRLAKRLGKPLVKVVGRIVPSEQVDREKIEALRQHADGRYLDAGRDGLYTSKTVNVDAVVVGGRRVRTRES